MSHAQRKIRVALLDAPVRYRHYLSILDHDDFSCINGDTLEFSDKNQLKTYVDVAICSQETEPTTALQIQILREAGIPTCHVMDGVLEWKNQWENPRSFLSNHGAPLYEPVLSDVVACLGPWQVELLQMLGARGICLPIGLPRLDTYKGVATNCKKLDITDSPRILVSTANKLGFTENHRTQMTQGLRNLREELSGSFAESEVTWRVNEDLGKAIGIPAKQIQSLSIPIHSAMVDYNLMLSTPSTILLEGMLAGLRVCQLNFTRSPLMIQTVWSCEEALDVGRTIRQMLSPSEHHIRYQGMLRDHQITPPGESTNRLCALLKAMGRGESIKPETEFIPREKEQLLSHNEAHFLQAQMNRLVQHTESSVPNRIKRFFRKLFTRKSSNNGGE